MIDLASVKRQDQADPIPNEIIRTDRKGSTSSHQFTSTTQLALTIIGALGVVIAGVGLWGMGVHQGWWNAGSLALPAQKYCISLMVTGGGIGVISFTVLIMGNVSDIKNPNHNQADPKLPAFDHKAAQQKSEKGRRQFSEALQARSKVERVQFSLLKDVQSEDFRGKVVEDDFKLLAQGGEHVCFTLSTLPGVLFKRNSGEGSMEDYVKRSEKARSICEKENFNFLYVPLCVLFEKNGISYAIEEKVDLLEGGFEELRSCYQWAVHDPQLQVHAKEALKELTLFVCRMGFGDVKYDNIPLTKDGRIALIDLDERSAFTGLTRGLASRKFGIFGIIPSTWFDEFHELATPLLQEEDKASLKSEMANLKQRAEARDEQNSKLVSFYKKRNIHLPTQPLLFDKKDFKDTKDPNVMDFIEKMIGYLNTQIKKCAHMAIEGGREFHVEYGKGLDISGVDSDTQFIQQGLELLKEKGYLFSYDFNWRSENTKDDYGCYIIC